MNHDDSSVHYNNTHSNAKEIDPILQMLTVCYECCMQSLSINNSFKENVCAMLVDFVVELR